MHAASRPQEAGAYDEIEAALGEAAAVFAATLDCRPEDLSAALLDFDLSTQEIDFVAATNTSAAYESLLRHEYNKPGASGEVGLALMQTRPVVLLDMDRAINTFDVGLDTLLGRRATVYAPVTEDGQVSTQHTRTRLILSIHSRETAVFAAAAESDPRGLVGLEDRLHSAFTGHTVYARLAALARGVRRRERHLLPRTARHRTDDLQDKLVERLLVALSDGVTTIGGDVPSMKGLGVAVAYVRTVVTEAAREIWKTVGMVIDVHTMCDQIRAERHGAAHCLLWRTGEHEDYGRLLETCVFDAARPLIQPALHDEAVATTFPTHPAARFTETLVRIRVSSVQGYAIAFGKRRAGAPAAATNAVADAAVQFVERVGTVVRSIHEAAGACEADEPMAPHWGDDLVRFLLQRLALATSEEAFAGAIAIVGDTCDRLFPGSLGATVRAAAVADGMGATLYRTFERLRDALEPDYTAVWRIGDGLPLDTAWRADRSGVRDHAIAHHGTPPEIRDLFGSSRVVARLRALARRLGDGAYLWDPWRRWLNEERIFLSLPAAFRWPLEVVVESTDTARCLILRPATGHGTWSTTLTFRRARRLATILTFGVNRDCNLRAALYDISRINGGEPDLIHNRGLAENLAAYPSIAINHHAAFRTGGNFFPTFADAWNLASPARLIATLDGGALSPEGLMFWARHVLPDLAGDEGVAATDKQRAILRLAQLHFRAEGYRERPADLELMLSGSHPGSLPRVAGLKAWVSQALIVSRRAPDGRRFVVSLFRAKPPFGAPGLLDPYGASIETETLGIFDKVVRGRLEHAITRVFGVEDVRPDKNWKLAWPEELETCLLEILNARTQGSEPSEERHGSIDEAPVELHELYDFLEDRRRLRSQCAEDGRAVPRVQREICKDQVLWSQALLRDRRFNVNCDLYRLLAEYVERCRAHRLAADRRPKKRKEAASE